MSTSVTRTDETGSRETIREPERLGTKAVSAATLIKQARQHLLTVIQAAWGSTPQYLFVRSRVLRVFGRDGLEQLAALEEGIISLKDIKSLDLTGEG